MYPISDLKKVKANNIRFKLSWRGESFLNKPYLILFIGLNIFILYKL